MRIKRYKKKRDLPILILKIAFSISILCLCVTYFYNQIRPVIISATGNQARVEVVRVLNQAILKELEENKIDYSDIVQLSRDSNGNVTSIETNTAAMNSFKAKIISVTLSKIHSLEERDLNIPMGTLSNVPFFLGKGPKINFKITSSGYADAKFESEFFSSGINQTCHRIKLIVTADVYALVPGFITKTTIITDYYIAETIIVGGTPDFFANID